MAPTQVRLNPHHTFIPNKPHPNGCMLNSVSDSKGMMLNLILRRRMSEDIDIVLFQNKSSYSWNRSQFIPQPTISPTNQVKNIFSYATGSIVCIDSYYGSYETVYMLAKSGVYCVCKCMNSK